ncbi:hypothetical protein M9Y10_005838 [Tritrichomonas musculus]|uniref:Surface antigen BspA-like n=1 Tax=Tritrichomonas musculus TaxID=1915356 RepID=A0ABR2JCX0_9EUKA
MTLIIKIDGISFELDNNNHTAKIIDSSNVKENILIPRVVKYQSNEYVITSIAQSSFKGQKRIKSICFSEDSGLLLIEKKAFFRSSITHLSLPSSIEKLEEGWCHSTPKLVSISISPQNRHFLFHDDKYLIAKMNENSEAFDNLLFVRRDIEQAVIPPFIKQISPYSFCDCKNCKSIEFAEKSEIQRIRKSSFINSSIEKVQIPTSMEEIEEGWCKKANKLVLVSISPNNKNFTFYKNNFLLGKSDPKNDEFDILLFGSHSIKKASIPSYIKRIGSHAFNECKFLKSVEFQSNSELITIGEKSFLKTSIGSIQIPATVEMIDKAAFFLCKSLKLVDFQSGSKLTVINEDAFNSINIQKVSIPSSVVEIGNKAFNSCIHLNSLKFEEDSKLQKIGDEAFFLTAIKSISIPSSVVEIGEKSFDACYDLTNVEFQADCKLKSIKKYAFSKAAIGNIIIPSSVKEVGEGCFNNCMFLQSIQFENGSEIETIETQLFFDSKIQSFSIPSKVKELKEGWCSAAPELTTILLSPENEHFKYHANQFLVGKSDEKSDIFDVLFFARRDIEHAIIPPFIKHIASYAFCDCSKLESVKFDDDSKLVSIGNFAFTSSTVKSISIPSSCNEIGKLAFACCHCLEKIDNFENLQIRVIEKSTFEWSGLKSLTIPAALEVLKEGWRSGTSELISCFVSPDNRRFSAIGGQLLLGKIDDKSDVFDILHFASRNLKQVKIPSSIKMIDSYAFCDRTELDSVEFEVDSQLRSIGNKAFCATKIDRISIPSSVKSIGQAAFYSCVQLVFIEFAENSELCEIDSGAFQGTSIKSIAIPKKVNLIKTLTFDCCYNLAAIELLGEEIMLEDNCFNSSLFVFSLPNAHKVCNLKKSIFVGTPKMDISVFVSVDAEIYW